MVGEGSSPPLFISRHHLSSEVSDADAGYEYGIRTTFMYWSWILTRAVVSASFKIPRIRPSDFRITSQSSRRFGPTARRYRLAPVPAR